MDKKLRVAIIGNGNISNYHVQGYKALPHLCEVVACCDLDVDKANAYAARYGIPAVYTDYNEMLEKEKPDAVSVCTWNAAHKGATVAALNAGAHVICEKPMAMNAKEAQEMVDAAKKNNKIVMTAFVRRFGNDADFLTDFIKGGTFGDIYYTKATYLRRNGCPGGWFGDKEYSGGGPLIDLGVHVMDLVRYLCGSPKPVSAFGVTYNNLGMDRAGSGEKAWRANPNGMFKYTVEDFASALIRFDNGMTMQLETSFNLNVKKDCGVISLFGTKAGAVADPQLEIYSDMNGHMINIGMTESTALSFDGLFEREIAHFVDCIVNGTECRVKPEDGVVLMKMIDAIYESAATGKEVAIEC